LGDNQPEPGIVMREIELRMTVFNTFEAWRARKPWAWVPLRYLPALFKVFGPRKKLRNYAATE
jgi:hypothetical protein